MLTHQLPGTRERRQDVVRSLTRIALHPRPVAGSGTPNAPSACSISEQPAIAARHVPGVEVEQRELDTTVADRRLDGSEIFPARPSELHGVRPGPGRAIEPVEKRLSLDRIDRLALNLIRLVGSFRDAESSFRASER